MITTLQMGLHVRMPTREQMIQIAANAQDKHVGEKLTIDNAMALVDEVKQAIAEIMELYLVDHHGNRVG
ncbi:hypothetical protein [Serratia marcescens]|uniref:hypothetical protein n=1 Tax=Serratia marcescens TaxID=615 RepID=UPI0034E8EAA3